jgi:hypothetical protein
VLIVAAAALSSWQAGETREAAATHWTVLLVVAVAFVAAIALGRGRQRLSGRRWLRTLIGWVRAWRAQPRGAVVSVVVWTGLINGVVGWDLTSFIAQSHLLPTLSYFIGHVTRYRIGRGAVFSAWLGIGAYFVAGARTKVTS